MNRKRGTKPYKPEDFILRFEDAEPRGPMSMEDMKATARALNKAFGGSEVKRADDCKSGG